MSVGVIQDLVTKFSFIGSPKPIHSFNEGVGLSIKVLGGMTAALATSAAGFMLWNNRVLGGVDSLDALTRHTRMSASEIQQWNFAAEQSQSSAAAMESTIRSLTSSIGQAALHGSADFARLGISVRDAHGQVRTAGDVLEDVRHRFRQMGLTMAEQEPLAQALGIDASLLQMLNRTDSEMASLRDRAQELGTLTAEQTEAARQQQAAMRELWFGLNSVKQLIAVGMGPEIQRLTGQFVDWLAANKDLIVNGVQATARFVGDLIGALGRLLPVIGLITAGFVAWKAVMIGMAVAAAPIIAVPALIAAGIVALLLIIDDLIVAFRGGESVIAGFFENVLGFDIVPFLHGVADAFLFMVRTAIGAIQQLWDFWKRAMQPIKAGLGAAARFFGIGQGGAGEPEAFSRPEDTIIPPGAGGGDVPNIDNRQVIMDVDIDISSNDPQAAGRSVEDALQRQLENANTQLGVGGR